VISKNVILKQERPRLVMSEDMPAAAEGGLKSATNGKAEIA
jgi:hypothetical protein